jgi:DNA repair protein RadC
MGHLAAKGPAVLSDTEIVEAIIGRGTANRDVRAIAKDICDTIRVKGIVPSKRICGIFGVWGRQKLPRSWHALS